MTHDEFTRARAFIAYQRHGLRLRAAAREAGISPSTMHRWKTSSWWGQSKKKNRKSSKDKHRRPSKLKPLVIEAIRSFYVQNNTALQVDLQHHLQQQGTYISRSSVSRAIKIAKLSRKRLSSHVLGQQDDAKVIMFDNIYSSLRDNGSLIVSTDEMYVSEKVVPSHMYSDVGQKRGLTKSKFGGWKQRSLIESIASDGTRFHLLVQGTVNRDRFAQYIASMPYPPGTVILLDNCTIHKKLSSAYDAKGFVPVFLSPYSPEFQPVEFAFSKIKKKFRNQYPWPNGVEEAVEAAEATITSDDIKAFFKHTFQNIDDYMSNINYDVGLKPR